MTLHVYSDMLQPTDSTEEWRHIPGIDHRYEVSNLGRVRSYCALGRYARVETPHIMTARPDTVGYLAVGMQVNRKRHTFKVHTLVARAFIGPCPPGYQVAHWDGDRTNSRLDNLRYATPYENTQDKNRHGTMCRGETDGNAKLTEGQVMEIRDRYARGEIQTSLATAFNISQSQVSNIVRGAAWSYLPTESQAA